MKIKELEKTVNASWSPSDHHPILLAAGTAAQQLDASFNTSAALEIYALNLVEPSLDLELKVSVPSKHRFHKIAWGGTSPGIIVGGCDNGVLEIYNVSKLLNKENGQIDSPERHTGAVRSLDFNPYQKNLLASGASNSEIYIWDMNNTAAPMTPGTKSQPFEDVSCLAWNRQVQHILASTLASRSVVWDLRKSEPIIKLTDSTSRVRWKVVAWHPEVATQLCLASEEDTNPVIQLWDLRFATAPVKMFHGHNRGVLSMAWCTQDPDLLISSGKDNKILCWNPNTNGAEAEIVCEIPNFQQWIFDVSWCPKNPSLIVSSSCDGHTSIYSLTGSPGQTQVSNKIADSFPGMDNYVDQQVQAPQSTVDLKKAPKWLRRPVGAKLVFGGKMLTFGPDGVKLFQVRLGDQLVEKAKDLEKKVAEGRQFEICQGKQDPIWRYLESCYSDDPAMAMRDLLGYNEEAVLKSLGIQVKDRLPNETDDVVDQFSKLGRVGDENSVASDGSHYGNREVVNGNDVFDLISQPREEKPTIQSPIKIDVNNALEGKVCQALLVGRLEEAVNLCLEGNRLADALVLAYVSGPEALAKIHQRYFETQKSNSLTSLIQALLTEDWESIISNCDLSSWKEALAGILTYKKDCSKLAELLGSRLEQEGREYAQCAEICYIASGNVSPLVKKRTTGVSLTVENIQDLVELVLVAQGAMNYRGLQLMIVDDVAKLLVRYCELLASEGELEIALTLLRDSQDDQVMMLKERLTLALGHKATPQYQNSAAAFAHPQNDSSRFGGPRHNNMYDKSYNAPHTNQINHAEPLAASNEFGKPPIGPHSRALPSSAPLPAASMPAAAPFTPHYQPPSSRSTSGPPPPAGPSINSNNFVRNTPSPVGQATSNKKYVVDPSVAGNMPFRPSSAASGMYGNQNVGYPNPAPFPASYNFQAPDNGYMHGSGPKPYSPSMYSGAPGMHDNVGRATPHQNFNNYETVQQPNIFKPSPTPPNQSSIYNPTQSVGFKPTPSNLPPSQQVFSAQHNPASGWNDPPLVAPKSAAQPKPDANSQSPITHPLFGNAPPQPEYNQPQQGFVPHQQGFVSNQQGFAPPQHQQQYANQSQPQHPPAPFSPQPFAPPSQQLSNQPLSGYGEPPGEMPKAIQRIETTALPDEFLHIQATFDDLRNKCLAASNNNPLMRRKLDDVARKLEGMYECLATRRLSPSALSGVEQLTTCARNSDFNSALGVITQMVSGSDFSQVSSFMTGVKVLFQTALQLRVN